MLHPVKPAPWRVRLRSEALRQAVHEGGLPAFDPWMKTAYPDYRMTQGSGVLERTLEALRTMTLDRERRSLEWSDCRISNASRRRRERIPLRFCVFRFWWRIETRLHWSCEATRQRPFCVRPTAGRVRGY